MVPIKYFGYNGNIFNLANKKRIEVLPHDYGGLILINIKLLTKGSGINSFQRQRLNILNVYYFDNKLLDTCTKVATSRRHNICSVASIE